MSIQCYGAGHIGLRRRDNQDSICFLENEEYALLAAVCDGIGDGLAGGIASRMTIKRMKESFLETEKCNLDVQVRHWLQNTIQEINDLIFTQSTRNTEQKGMGTILVGTLKCETATYIFNVGDSRTYGPYTDDFLALTGGHSYIADVLEHGELSGEEATVHPSRSMLTNALGIRGSVRIGINKTKNDYKMLLVCSDGLHDYVSKAVIREILESKRSVEDEVRMLIDKILLAGSCDNVSAITVEQAGNLHE